MDRNILYLHHFKSESSRQMILGVQRFAATKSDWNLNMLDDCSRSPSLREVLRFWNPDGCIAECAGVAQAFRPTDFGSIPLIMLNRSADDHPDTTPSVFLNERKTALLATKETLRLARSNIAFVSWREKTTWSSIRETVFRKAARVHGYKMHCFHPWKHRNAEAEELQHLLREFLLALPKPAALQAANDVMAREVLSAAHAVSISVPDELAVISIDNNELITRATKPTLTTVNIDFTQAGFLAAELLDERFQHPTTRLRNRFFGPLGIVRRGSSVTTKRKDTSVVETLDYIRLHCTESISAKTVAARFPCSRRMAEIRFRAATGHSIGEEILGARLGIVKNLLRAGTVRLDTIPSLAGWKSSAVLRQYFKRTTGFSMRDWRKTQTISSD